MILKNIDEVLTALDVIFDQVDTAVFDADDGSCRIDEKYLPFSWDLIQKLYPIKDGINYLRENYPNLAIQLSMSEIGHLTKAKIKPELTTVI